MSDAVDTSAEAVERMAAWLTTNPASNDVAPDVEIAATLRALLAERDENKKAAAVWRGRTQRAEAERDAAQTKAKRLQEALRELVDAFSCEIIFEGVKQPEDPAIVRARAALAKEQTND